MHQSMEDVSTGAIAATMIVVVIGLAVVACAVYGFFRLLF